LLFYFLNVPLIPKQSSRKLIPVHDARAWHFASCRRFLPWGYSDALVRGAPPVVSAALTVPPKPLETLPYR